MRAVTRGVALGIAVLAAGCAGAEVHLRNRSAAEIRNVTIATKGDTARFESLDAFADVRTWICPDGEAGHFVMTFTVNGQQHRSEQRVYFECSTLYQIQVDVLPTFAVASSARLR